MRRDPASSGGRRRPATLRPVGSQPTDPKRRRLHLLQVPRALVLLRREHHDCGFASPGHPLGKSRDRSIDEGAEPISRIPYRPFGHEIVSIHMIRLDFVPVEPVVKGARGTRRNDQLLEHGQRCPGAGIDRARVLPDPEGHVHRPRSAGADGEPEAQGDLHVEILSVRRGTRPSLAGTAGLAPGTAEYGGAFESFVFQEIKAFCDYHRLDTPRYWGSKSKFEVDFVFEGLAVAVKAKKNVGARDLRGLRALREEGLFDHCLLVSMESAPRVVDGIRILPWSDFLDRLWGGEWL